MAILLTPVANASIPAGKQHGVWHVISIASLSGGGDGGAAVLISQTTDHGELGVRWDEPGDVLVSITLQNCNGDRFEQGYHVSASRWLETPKPVLVRRIRQDFSTWFSRAKFVCAALVAQRNFQMGQLGDAINDFTERLRYLYPVRGRVP